MSRSGRTYFFILGVVPLLNAHALLLYGLNLATSGSGGTERVVPVLLVLAVAGLLALGMAVVKRGRAWVGRPGPPSSAWCSARAWGP